MIITRRRIPPPPLPAPPLFPHQEQAVQTFLNWESTPFQGIKGGLLAFRMGLGKTRTCLELVYRTRQQGEPTLVVCNKSNIQVWVSDTKRFYSGTLKYFVLHPEYCDTSQVSWSTLDEYDLIITTYETIRKLFYDADPECYVITENNFMIEQSGLFRESDIPDGFKIVNIKKPNPKRCKNKSIIYSRCWQRIISDESQKFVNTNSSLYKSMITLVGKSYICLSGTPIVNYSHDLYSVFRFMGFNCTRQDWSHHLYNILKLKERILMKDYSDTTIKLPEIKIINEFVELKTQEQKMYNAIISMLKAALALFKKGNATFSAPLAMFTRLRQVCCAPHILMYPTGKAKKMAKKLKDILHIVETHDDVDFDYVAGLLGVGKDSDEDQEIINQQNPELKDDDCAICTEEKQETGYLMCSHAFCFSCIKEWQKTRNTCPICRCPFNHVAREPRDLSTRIKDEIFSLENPDFFESQYLNDYARNMKTSGKIDKIISILEKHPNSKVLIFSTFVEFLKLIQKNIEGLGIKTMLFSGSVNTQDRQDMVDYFQSNPSIRIFLSSFKCGGVGLNLTAADVVIVCEPWWNPATEEQAIARSHRVGQNNNVLVYNLIIHPSFEEHLLYIHEKKRKIMYNYLGKTDTKYSRVDNISAQAIIEYILNDKGYGHQYINEDGSGSGSNSNDVVDLV